MVLNIVEPRKSPISPLRSPKKSKTPTKRLHLYSLEIAARTTEKNQNRHVTALMSLPLRQPERQVALPWRQNQNRNLAALILTGWQAESGEIMENGTGSVNY
jgi:hypothetical protein